MSLLRTILLDLALLRHHVHKAVVPRPSIVALARHSVASALLFRIIIDVDSAIIGSGNCTSNCNAQAQCGQYAPAGSTPARSTCAALNMGVYDRRPYIYPDCLYHSSGLTIQRPIAFVALRSTFVGPDVRVAAPSRSSPAALLHPDRQASGR